MHTKKQLDELMAEAGINPLKKLGQNFLINSKICEQILQAALSFPEADLVEIGPGLGALTQGLINSKRPLTLIELDRGLVEFWQRKGARVLHQDAVQTDWASMAPFVLVSNLPYSIAGTLIVDMCTLENVLGMVLMMQKEVAQRITAPVNDSEYGFLSVLAQTIWNVQAVVDAGPQDFFPVPNVGSRVLQFKARNINLDKRRFCKFVKQAFSQRRKKMLTNLTSLFPKADLETAIAKIKNVQCRAQELSPQQFVDLFETLAPR